jgi:integrase
VAETLTDLRSKLRHVSNAFGDRKVSDLDAAAISQFLRDLPHRSLGKKGIRTKLSQFLNYCRREGKWIADNPAESIKVRINRREVSILMVPEIRRLLTVASSSRASSSIVPFFALQLFGGLRPFEAAQIHWSAVHFETAQVEVRAATSKRRESRYVPLEPVLTEILMKYRRAHGLVVGPRSLPERSARRQDRSWPRRLAD